MTTARTFLLCLACAFAGTAAADPDGVRESYLEAPAGQGVLKGTLLAPAAAPSAAVLIVPGSGPIDRDGNSPLGVRASTYRLLAEGLAAHDVAALRIDKRGMFASATAAADANDVTIADYAADVQAWVAVLRKATGVPCVWVLGHSEGGLVALAAGSAPGICGLVLVSTPGRTIGDVLRAQIESNPANAALVAPARQAIATLEKGERVDARALPPALQALFRPQVQGFLISEMACDPARLAAGLRKPVFVLQGQRDLQVGEDDARRLERADPAAELRLLPGVNHVLKSVASDDRRANLAAYADPSLPLAAGVVDAIVRFVTQGRQSGS